MVLSWTSDRLLTCAARILRLCKSHNVYGFAKAIYATCAIIVLLHGRYTNAPTRSIASSLFITGLQTLAQSRITRQHITIAGAVQGVGFRPFIYRLATSLHLNGYVNNTPAGVIIEVEGTPAHVETFLTRLPLEKPPLAIILHLNNTPLPSYGYDQFEIYHSVQEGTTSALVLPDIAPCADCLHDIFDTTNRRYHYAFTNCTNCGPRFSIIQQLPYDRSHTTMRSFTMCDACHSEYTNPLDRRFHAQPNACGTCGPHLYTYTNALTPTSSPQRSTEHLSGVENFVGAQHAAPHVPTRHTDQDGEGTTWSDDTDDSIIQHTANSLSNGLIVAIKGLGGFHLMVDARNSEAVNRLRIRKQRSDKPFALMVRDIAQAETLCHISPQAASLLTSPEAPIVLLPKRADAPIASNIAPDVATLGIMLPSTPLHHLLMQQIDFPVIATSGNLSDEPICTDNQEAFDRLHNIADMFVVHDRPIQRHVDDSIAWLPISNDSPQLLRRARGYAPLPVMIPAHLPTILAVGAHLKNSIALSLASSTSATDVPTTPLFISQHIGDLETPQALAAFERVIEDFLRLYHASPVAIAHDMHPDYLSTHYAKNLGQRCDYPSMLVAVQHHHAHFAACLADNGITGKDTKALGIVWDGTGYGTDGTIWGGEFLYGNAATYQRVAHVRQFRLPGGEAAVREPRRVALALVWELAGADALAWDYLAPIASFSATERTLMQRMLEKEINTPMTTSAGRLFDGIAALLGIRQTVTFEGQAAIALEYVAQQEVFDFQQMEHMAYPLPIVAQTGSSSSMLDWVPLVQAILHDIQHGVSLAHIAVRFHLSLVMAMVAVAKRVGEKRVALSGGCFQNRLLTTLAHRSLQEAGFEVLLHRQVPPNDGGISLGQVVVAAQYVGEGSG